MRVEGRGQVIAEGVQDPGFHANTTKGIKEIREKEKEKTNDKQTKLKNKTTKENFSNPNICNLSTWETKAGEGLGYT